jgi:uncharacterized protein YaaN involved in tellurite resistance
MGGNYLRVSAMSQASQSISRSEELARINQQEASNRETEIRLKAEVASIERDVEAATQRAISTFGTADITQMRALYQQYDGEDKAALAQVADVVSRRTNLLKELQARLEQHRATQVKG